MKFYVIQEYIIILHNELLSVLGKIMCVEFDPRSKVFIILHMTSWYMYWYHKVIQCDLW